MKPKKYTMLPSPDNTPRLGAIYVWRIAMTPSLRHGSCFCASMCNPIWEILNIFLRSQN